MKARKLTLLAVAAAALVAAGSAFAITYGHFDGNDHPSTGAMVYLSPTTGQYRIVCTGTLISPTVFLTASHCTAALEERGLKDVWVTFDPTFDQKSKLHHGTYHTNPLYNQAQNDPGDIAVITLDKAITSIAPVKLPAAGLLDRMKAEGTLASTRFTSVGYGIQEPQPSPGGIVNAWPMERWASDGEFTALTAVWLRVAQTQATGDGGSCNGDSGGPQFLGAGATETTTQVSVTITGDLFCFATNVDYRLDTPQARAFLGRYVRLP